MARTRIRVTGIVSLAASAWLMPLAGAAHAQAWVPEAGEATVSIGFQQSFVENHYFATARADRGHITANSLTIDTSFGVTRKFSLDVALPYVASRYDGASPHPSALDNGAFHGTAQDFRFAARYNLRSDGLVITPYAAAILPSHDYEFYAHSAPGQRLREFQIGAYVARLLDPVLPGAFFQARYGYGFTEKTLGISHNRSHADFEVGYFITPAVRAFALSSALLTHGGIDIIPSRLTPEQTIHHDQIGRFNHLNVGGGASVSLNESVDVFGSVMRTVAARNGHELARSISVGVSLSLARARKAAPVAAEDTTSERSPYEGSLVRCICQKGI